VKIISITLTNFRQFYGENTVKFATDPKHPLTLIHGLNGAGKSTLLNAFKWCMYGKHNLSTAQPDYDERMFTELAEGSTLDIKVRLCFEHEGMQYDAIRSHSVQKKDGIPFWSSSRTNLSLTVRDFSGRTSVINNPSDLLSQILPEEMHPYFFFAGEQMKEELGNTESQHFAENIKKAIKSLMDISTIENAIRHMNTVARNFQREISSHGNTPIQQIQDGIEERNRRIQEKKEDIERQKREISFLTQDLEAISAQLKKIEPVKHLQENRDLLDSQYKLWSEELVKCEKNCKLRIQENAALPFLRKAAQQVVELINEKREKGTLPSGIQETFIRDLLDRHVCICNREFHEGDEVCNALQELLNRQSGNAHIECRIMTLSGRLGDLENSCAAFQRTLADFVETRKNIRNELKSTNEKLSEIHSQIAKIGTVDNSENPAELERVRMQKEDERIHLSNQIARDERDVETLVADITRLDRQLAEATRDNEQSHLAARRRITAINIEKALNALNGILVQRVKDSVTAEISQTLGKITDSYMDGEITPEFRYNIYRNDSGHRAPLAPSDGQKQIASLVFIASLIKIARQNMEDHHTNSFMRGGEYPLVMDAPFSAADDVYAPRTAEFLTQTTQEVIMTNPGQLRIFENAIRPYVGAEYLIVKHENNVLDQQLLTLPTGDRKALRKQIEGNQYSTIEEV